MRALLLSILAIVAIPTGLAAAAENAPLIRETDLGRVEGIDGEVQSFLGIPFAAPPTGELRWRAPVAPPAWSDIKDARSFAPDCIGSERLRAGSRASSASEDCLYLNIWSPRRDSKERLPVMVWVYGGGFVGGTSSAPYYDGAALARQGVIVVTFNYRMGVLGFLAHPALSKENPNSASGNYGLLDMLAAFQWVQRNIAAFGGDPDRVTVFGESAGASALGLLITSPLSEGLFNQAILESPGLARPLATLSQSEEQGLQLGTDLSALRQADATELMKLAQSRIPASRQITEPRVIGPILDGYVLHTPDVDAFASGTFNKVPVLVGGNAEEGRTFTDQLPIKTLAQYENYLVQQFGEAAPSWERCYPAQSDDDVPAAISRLFGDNQFNHGIDMLTEAYAKWDVPLWRYRFDGVPGTGRLPATHGDEIPYVFGNLGPSSVSMFSSLEGGAGEADTKLAATISAAWARFAAHGSPGHPKQLHWPRFDRGGKAMIFGSRVALGDVHGDTPSGPCPSYP
ncbi:carboxylesterase/lipase family protein [Sphingopyxis granuli]|jgi:para-nitrobenzyl esterase|uniref:carboxylesterase/lipase family protein n=1 Tax=Sphingopyxis granuli TaxID=267128 RepID=UPI00301E195E